MYSWTLPHVGQVTLVFSSICSLFWSAIPSRKAVNGTAVLAEVVSVLVGHNCSLRVDAKPGLVQHAERGVDKPLDCRNQAHSA